MIPLPDEARQFGQTLEPISNTNEVVPTTRTFNDSLHVTKDIKGFYSSQHLTKTRGDVGGDL